MMHDASLAKTGELGLELDLGLIKSSFGPSHFGVDVVGMQCVAGGPFTWGHVPRYSHAMAQREAVTESAEMRFQLAEEKHHGKERGTAFGGAETKAYIFIRASDILPTP